MLAWLARSGMRLGCNPEAVGAPRRWEKPLTVEELRTKIGRRPARRRWLPARARVAAVVARTLMVMGFL